MAVPRRLTSLARRVPHGPLQPHLDRMPVHPVLGGEYGHPVLYGLRLLGGEGACLYGSPGVRLGGQEMFGEVDGHGGILRGGVARLSGGWPPGFFGSGAAGGPFDVAADLG